MEKNVKKQVAEATEVKGNETQVLNPNVSEVKTVSAVEKTKKKSRRKSELEKTLEKYRNLYRRQVTKNVETRRAVLRSAINELGVSYGYDEFLKDIYPRLFRLLDSKRFEQDCTAAGLIPYNAAVYIALQNTQSIYNVLDYGIVSQFGSQFSEMKVPVVEKDEFRPYDMWKVLTDAPVSTQSSENVAS